MNIYEKLQTMRCELQNSKMKKSGKNKFAGYEYFELQDFIPQINEMMLKHKVTSVLRYGTDLAELSLYNTEKPDEVITFTSPMAEANLKGCHAVQNLGATETYIRRYLYITAFEIIEHDALDSGKLEEDVKVSPQMTEPTKETPAMQELATRISEEFMVCTDIEQLKSLAKHYKKDIGKMSTALHDWLKSEYKTAESVILNPPEDFPEELLMEDG